MRSGNIGLYGGKIQQIGKEVFHWLPGTSAGTLVNADYFNTYNSEANFSKNGYSRYNAFPVRYPF